MCQYPARRSRGEPTTYNSFCPPSHPQYYQCKHFGTAGFGQSHQALHPCWRATLFGLLVCIVGFRQLPPLRNKQDGPRDHALCVQ